ncbi:MAG: rod shape-determining protein RodA [Chloroflexi bacterium]|nr:MAG: rod shape-determining protein RodA [Chloroflexota bacterium]MBL1196490.1 rod shape-determining protein RodA [Chloroflexota bacterium]NOH13785.1 rod shape-determining protein RodA [Chloroflexota bacterium]
MRREIWRHFDFWLMGAMALLIIIGVAMIQSSIAGNIELVENNTTGRHIIFALVGFAAIIVATMMDYHLWVTISRILYALVAILFFVILIAGEAAFGSARFLDLVFFTIQPSELAKLTIIILLADFFQKHQGRVGDLSVVVRSGLLTAFLVVLIILQPDLSTSIVLMVIWFALLWAAGLQMKHLALFAVVGLVVAAVAIPFLADYQQQRLINFVFPDPEATFGENYNVNQALITVGSGGLLGQGYGQGSQVQLRFLKVRWSDFIFSSIANELGFVGSLVIMALLFIVIWRCLRAARLAPDTTGALIAYGVATWIAFQAIVNIGMNLNLLPVTGLPLPFVSHGGSALLSLMLGIGLVQSVVSRQRTSEL